MGRTSSPLPSPIPKVESERAVYDGDINTSIQTKFAEYIINHHYDKDYVVYRPNQYTYKCLIGDWDGRTMNNCTILEYYSYGYNDNVTFTVTQSSSITPDLSGDTGFIYSSDSAFVPLAGVAEYRCTHSSMLVSVGLVISILSYLIYKFVIRGLSHREN